MKAVAILGFLLFVFPAHADNPAAPGLHDVPPLSEFNDVFTRISASPKSGNSCVIDASVIDRDLDDFLAMALMQAGFPNAAPSPIWMDPPLNPPPVKIKPGFTVEATTKLKSSDSTNATCVLAMRAEVALGGDQRLVLWSSPLVILEADAGPDPQRPSRALKATFKTMMQEMARVFVSAWHGVYEPMKVPD
jgi:hypothetical protein